MPDGPDKIAGQSEVTIPGEAVEAVEPIAWTPDQNCYCGGPEEIYPHRIGSGYYCRRERTELVVRPCGTQADRAATP